ncbi:MAG TPA: lysophospholipid acyltransferase family protein [Longimicrobiales bacterium]|nr:lysophospholipid acyltransferase family protein [Longimicrobiales bacterium]
MSNDVKLKHRIEYALFRAALSATARLGDAHAARVGEVVGAAGYPLGIRKRVVERNLRIAFPGESEQRRERIARAAYAHLGREMMMMLRLSAVSREQLLSRTRLVNEQEMRACYLAGRGIVSVAGHLGNWEIGAALIAARDFRIDIIAKRASNPLFYRRILAARARLGVGVIDFEAAARQGLRALRAGHVVAFGADQHAPRGGVRVPFFGREVSAYRGPALMALRTGAPMFLSLPLRRPDGVYEMGVEPIDTTPTGDLEADVLRVTAEWTRRLEEAVRQAPEQYLWHHRRWRD